ncbi:MAG: IS30 family transposase [Spirochaetaceae bacterium]|nr:IS30 family transposase [Spirochaetaceae bacterium]
MSYERITLEEREEIFRLRYEERLFLREIGQRLNKHKSSILRELKRGTRNKLYNPIRAEVNHRNARKRQCPKLKMTSELWAVIKSKLEQRWSSAQVVQWLEKEYPCYTMSEKTIYNYIHFHMKGELKKIALEDLRQKGKKRRKTTEKGENRGKISEMTLIDGRAIPGHWEGDLIIGKGHKSALCVMVERRSRFVQIDLLERYDAATVRKTIEKRFKRLGGGLCKTITFDQGKENSEHKVFTERTGIKVYFCHPHSPWEKGTCENTNFLIRDMLKGVTDFRELNQRYISQIAKKLNERPRKTLDFLTPNEVLFELR